jgi:hypothetical protein
MSYFKTPNPAFPLRRPGMGDYVPAQNPAFPGPSAFVSDASCCCNGKKKRRNRKSLGQVFVDDSSDLYTGLNPDGSVDTSWMGSNAPTVPPGYGYGPNQQGGTALYPITTSTPVPSPSLTSGVSPSIAIAPAGIGAPTVSQVFGGALSTLSTSTLLLGGGALLVLALVASGKRR